MLGAAPARAGGSCNLHYIFNYDGSNVWSNMTPTNIRGPVTLFSCSATPAIARGPGSTVITGEDDSGTSFITAVNSDGSGSFSTNGIDEYSWVGVLAMVSAPPPSS